jgi:hypothetical protein
MKEDDVRYFHRTAIGFLGIIMIATGCVGQGERIDLDVSIASETHEKAVAMSAATVVVLPFEDDRTNRSHLGVRYHLWGGESYFTIPLGTLGEATAQAFADYLKRKGLNATSAEEAGFGGADISITGKLVDVAVDAKSGIGQTVLNARSRLIVQVKNHVDGSQIRETLTSTGADQVFWFDPEDAQELLNELYNKNFEKFVNDTILDGKILRLR